MSKNTRRKAQQGSTVVEFALILIFYLTFLLGVLDMARLLWTWNAASEATRWGARTAVVCDRDAAAVLARMQTFLPQLTEENLVVDWYDGAGTVSASCTAADCQGVNVRIQNLNYQWLAPLGFSSIPPLAMPGFSTYLPREIMGQDPGSAAICSS